MNTLTTANNAQTSIQISKLYDIPAGNTTFGQPSLIKNITTNDVIASVLLAGNTQYISTVFYPGWNVELVSSIERAVVNQLQYGN